MSDTLEVEVTVLVPGQIRLKFHGLPNDSGPDLLLNEITARELVDKLNNCLPSNPNDLDIKNELIKFGNEVYSEGYADGLDGDNDKTGMRHRVDRLLTELHLAD